MKSHLGKKTTVIVVDDHEIVRSGIVSLLSGIEGIKVLAEASSGETAVKYAQEFNPDVVLMDVRMPGIGGLQATINIVRFCPNTKVIALTVCNDDLFPTKLLQAGAHGYLTKNTNKDEIKTAIQSVVQNKRYISPEIASKIALRHLSDEGGVPFDSLSERELQVTMMITKGHKVQQISDVLFLSPKTVNSYRYRIFEKLNVSNDVELTRLAIKHGLVEDLEIKDSE
ncbi:MAG: UvrY/SirA/GacA family response regulator transcription factor [Pseudomonadota bacterium]|nr:UvrY/SirA/GacA family response regulator transcription factor [Pseudomonadota bacterium]